MWVDAAPVEKVVHNVKASVDIDVHGRAKIMLSFSDTFFREMGEPKKITVQFGSGENIGKIRLVPGVKGIETRPLSKGGAHVKALIPDDNIPKRVRELEPCTELERPAHFVRDEDGRMIGKAEPGDAWMVTLPLKVRSNVGGVEKPVEPIRPAAPPPATAKVASIEKMVGALDAAAYLKKHGIKCHKLAGDWWMINNDKVNRFDVLARVNEVRRGKELPALGIDNIE